MSTNANTPAVTIGFNPAAGIAAVLFPGAGHAVRGEYKRAFLIAFGVLGLFFGGIFIGGIDVIDREEDTPWFYGQSLVGPLAFGANYVHQTYFKVREPGRGGLIYRSANPDEGRDPKTGAPIPGQTPPNIKSLSKVNELGTLFATIAGMLNVIVIMDALFPASRRLRQVGFKATLADAESPLGTPAVGDDPLRGATPGTKTEFKSGANP